METVISSKGQILIPAELRELDGIVAGRQFELERIEARRYLLKRLPSRNNVGLIDALLSCPEQDWFVELPRESTANR